MRRVRREVGEERRFRRVFLGNPLRRLRKKNIRAVALGFLEHAVVENRGIKIFVARRVATTALVTLPDAARAVDEHLVEPALIGLIRRFIAEMPLAENARRVARGFQHLRDRRGLQRHALAFENRVRDAVAKLVPARHQRRARRRARRADVEIREAHGLRVKAINVRRFDERVAVTGEIAVALIIGHHEHDVRAFAKGQIGGVCVGGVAGHRGNDGEKNEAEQAQEADGFHDAGRWLNRCWKNFPGTLASGSGLSNGRPPRAK